MCGAAVKAVDVKGSYLLVLQLETALQQLKIGQLGSFDFAAGYYLYVGSAFGAGGLPARLAYHQREYKEKPHWHIDYLRPYTHLLEAWTVACSKRLECHWCQALGALPDLHIPIRHFGSRDTGCPAHLFYTTSRPKPLLLTQLLLEQLTLIPAEQPELLVEIHLFEEKPVARS